MTSLRRGLLVVGALAGCWAGHAAAPLADPHPAGPGPVISAGDPFFGTLCRKLAAQGSVRSAFTEYRFFPFRTRAIVLQGEMRFSRDLGLSLHYARPEDRTIIADSQGLLIRDAHGHSRAISADERIPDLGRTLLPILRFDEDELLRHFEVRAARSAGAWRVDFTPKDGEVARWIGVIGIEGEGARVLRIEFRRSESQRIDIHVESSETGVAFGPKERALYFR